MAKFDILTHLDFNKQQILNAKLQNLPTHPAVTPDDIGFIYWNTADNTPYGYSGVAWIDLGALYVHPLFPGASIPVGPLTGGKVFTGLTLDNGHVVGATYRDITPEDIGAATASHTHAFSEIVGLPANTILANNTGTAGAAKAITVADMLVMLGIAYGSAALLTAGTDTAQRTWSAKMIKDYVAATLGSYLTVVNLGVTTTSTAVTITNSAGANAVINNATPTVPGVMSAADKAKLDAIAANANNYVHPSINPGVHPFDTEITGGLLIPSQLVVNALGHLVTIKGRTLTAADLAAVLFNNAVNNGTNTTWSSTKIYTEIQAAIAQAQTGALTYRGDYNPVTNTPAITTLTTVKTGFTYVVSVAGTFLTEDVEAGDMIIAKKDSPLAVLANWQLVNKNIPAIVAATTTVAGIVALATSAEGIAGTNNTKAITPLVLKAVLDSVVGGYSATFGNGSGLTFAITHGLNTKIVIPEVQRVSDGSRVWCDIKVTSATVVTVNMNIPPMNNEYILIIKK